ncbi:MAG: DHH family phosphoesterase [Phycisphaerales bacterium]|nr:DHH family phosphoesterase [Phycisphaerales bacterium]
MDALRQVKYPFLVAHVTPDADAIGSALGLATAMREQGIEAAIGLPEGCVADKLLFMLSLAPETPLKSTWTPNDPFDAAIVLDTAGEKRINIQPVIDLSGNLPVFNIDHHITNTDFGQYNWVDPHATSTCELVARLLKKLDWSLSPAVASLLYAGIHGDTAGFSLPTTSADALHTAGELVRCGADVTHIGEQLCRSQARPDFELLRRVYDQTTITSDGQIAYSYLSHDDFLASGSKAEAIDDQVSIPLALKGVRIAMLFSEGEKGVVRINLRGEGNVEVLEIAQRFGGGGHAHAAGVRVRNKPIQDVAREVVAAATEHLKTHLIKSVDA